MLRKLTITGLVFALATWGSLCFGGQFTAAIKAAAIATSPKPGPPPDDSTVCSNCGGTGKLGDGTVSVTCPVCDGTGKPKNAGSTSPASAPASHSYREQPARVFSEQNLPADQQPTPMPGVTAAINELGPLANKRLVVYGSGFDARMEITAARREPTLTVVGIEIDPDLAASARRFVADNGLSDRITIMTGDAITTDVEADLGMAYLYEETLAELRPKIEQLDRFVSYGFAVPGLTMEAKPVVSGSPIYGGTVYVWKKPAAVTRVPVTQSTRRIVSLPRGSYCQICGRHCSNPMAHKLQQQIVGYKTVPAVDAQRSTPVTATKRTTSNCPNGNCPNGNCSKPSRGLFGGLFRR